MNASLGCSLQQKFEGLSCVRPAHMKDPAQKPLRAASEGSARFQSGFTLIELLVVIAIIAILAAMFLTSTGDAKYKAMLQTCRAELPRVQMAVGGYKADTGSYPPDNPSDPAVNQLY